MRRKEKALAEAAALLVLKKSGRDLGGRRGRLIQAFDRLHAIKLIDEAIQAGARSAQACKVMCVSCRTIERWKKPSGEQDKRKIVDRFVANKLTLEERQDVINIANNNRFQDLPQIRDVLVGIIVLVACIRKYAYVLWLFPLIAYGFVWGYLVMIIKQPNEVTLLLQILTLTSLGLASLGIYTLIAWLKESKP